MDDDEKTLINAAMAAVIRGARNTEGLTQRELADASGINYETMKNIEKGTHKISVVQVAQLADALHLPVRELVDRAMLHYQNRLAPAPIVS